MKGMRWSTVSQGLSYLGQLGNWGKQIHLLKLLIPHQSWAMIGLHVQGTICTLKCFLHIVSFVIQEIKTYSNGDTEKSTSPLTFCNCDHSLFSFKLWWHFQKNCWNESSTSPTKWNLSTRNLYVHCDKKIQIAESALHCICIHARIGWF